MSLIDDVCFILYAYEKCKYFGLIKCIHGECVIFRLENPVNL